MVARSALVFGMLLLLILAACTKNEMIAEMAIFDRKYIPALQMTLPGSDRGEAMLAVTEFRMSWSRLKSKVFLYAGEDPDWEAVKVRFERLVEKCDRDVGAGDLRGGHRALQDMGAVLIGFREKLGIDYFPDRLVRFHSEMDVLYYTADNDVLSPGELDLITAMLPGTISLWDEVMAARFSPGLYGFDRKKAKLLKHYLQAESDALGDLKTAHAQNDRSAMLRALKGIKAPFMKAYILFGGA